MGPDIARLDSLAAVGERHQTHVRLDTADLAWRLNDMRTPLAVSEYRLRLVDPAPCICVSPPFPMSPTVFTGDSRKVRKQEVP
jgi:hypothetical protein